MMHWCLFTGAAVSEGSASTAADVQFLELTSV